MGHEALQSLPYHLSRPWLLFKSRTKQCHRDLVHKRKSVGFILGTGVGSTSLFSIFRTGLIDGLSLLLDEHTLAQQQQLLQNFLIKLAFQSLIHSFDHNSYITV